MAERQRLEHKPSIIIPQSLHKHTSCCLQYDALLVPHCTLMEQHLGLLPQDRE